MLDLVFLNRPTGKFRGGVAITQYLLDGGVSFASLESGARFPFFRADGGTEAVAIKRGARIEHA